MKNSENTKQEGTLPEGWKKIRLADLFEDSYPGEWGDEPNGELNTYPVFSTIALDYDGNIDFNKTELRKLPNKKINKLLLKKGTILIEKSGGSVNIPAGKVAILKEDFWGTCSNFIQILKINNKKSNSYFLFYRLLFNFINHQIEKYQQRTTGIINFILRDYFNDFISLPPLSEQQKIAEILETVDRAIEKTNAIIEKYRRIKQGMMHDLLTRGIDENGKIRSEKTHRFKNSPLGKIPEEWEVARLGDFAFVTKLAGFEYTRFFDYSLEGEIILIRALNIRDGKLDLSNAYTMPKDISVKLNRSKLDKNDIVMSYVGTIGECAIIPFDDKFHLAPNVAKISIRKKNLMPEFILNYLLGFQGKREINLIMSSTTQAALSMSNIRTIRVLLPPLPEQQRIAEILSQLDETIEKEEKYKVKLERIKQGLMEDLLTGKRRVI
ncbi:MAG TPA: restriction endonuclease subunit S [Candidatus Paceibacterota bacterium]|nr:restriction endonuclease subunit S [Candidatus Paceibacterota bacterium]